MGAKREGETEADQPPPKVIVRAYNVPEPQAGTIQQYKISSSKSKKPSHKTHSQHHQCPDCQQTAKTGIKSQVFSQADQPHDQPSVLLRDENVEIIQAQAFLTYSPEKDMHVQLETENQELTVCPRQTRTKVSSEWPQQLSDSSNSTVIQSVTVTLHQQHPASEPKSECQAMSVIPQQDHGLMAKAHSFPKCLETSHMQVKTPAQAQIQLHAQEDTQRHTQLGISPQTAQQAQTRPKVFSPSKYQKQQGHGNVPGPRHVPGQSEVFSRAQAMARSRMNKAKEHLHEYIEEVIAIFSNRIISKERARVKQVNLNIYYFLFIYIYLT